MRAYRGKNGTKFLTFTFFFRIIKERIIAGAADTEEKFCIKAALKGIQEEIQDIKASLALVKKIVPK